MCDRVAIIREGRLVRIGGVAELKDIRHHELELTFAATPAVDAFRGLAGLERLEPLPDGRHAADHRPGRHRPAGQARPRSIRLVNIVSQRTEPGGRSSFATTAPASADGQADHRRVVS